MTKIDLRIFVEHSSVLPEFVDDSGTLTELQDRMTEMKYITCGSERGQ